MISASPPPAATAAAASTYSAAAAIINAGHFFCGQPLFHCSHYLFCYGRHRRWIWQTIVLWGEGKMPLNERINPQQVAGDEITEFVEEGQNRHPCYWMCKHDHPNIDGVNAWVWWFWDRKYILVTESQFVWGNTTCLRSREQTIFYWCWLVFYLFYLNNQFPISSLVFLLFSILSLDSYSCWTCSRHTTWIPSLWGVSPIMSHASSSVNTSSSTPLVAHTSSSAVSPLINLETQHDGRSAQVWMKRVILLFVVVMGGRKGFAREHQNGFYKT